MWLRWSHIWQLALSLSFYLIIISLFLLSFEKIVWLLPFFYSVNHILLCKSFIFIIIILSFLLFSLWLTNFFYCRSTNLKKQCKLICFLSFRCPDMWWSGDTLDTTNLVLSSPSDHLLGAARIVVTGSIFSDTALLRCESSMSNNGLFVLFRIWSLGFLVYSFLSQKFLICKYIPFKLTFIF